MRERLSDRQGAEYYYFIGRWQLTKNNYILFRNKQGLIQSNRVLAGERVRACDNCDSYFSKKNLFRKYNYIYNIYIIYIVKQNSIIFLIVTTVTVCVEGIEKDNG